MNIRFHLDENVNLAIAEALRRRGIDVTTPFDPGLVGATDDLHLAYAREQGRMVVTHDADFLRINAMGVKHARIAFCHSGSRSLREIIRDLTVLAASRSAESMANTVEYL